MVKNNIKPLLALLDRFPQGAIQARTATALELALIRNVLLVSFSTTSPSLQNMALISGNNRNTPWVIEITDGQAM
jgi:hypothetical protein